MGWDSLNWQEKMIRSVWQLAGGKPFFHRNLPPGELGLGNPKSVGATISKLAKFGWLEPVDCGKYDFTEKAKNLFEPAPTAPAAELWGREGEEPLQILILTPGEFHTFQSLDKCHPRTVEIGAKKRDRITEKDIDTSQLETEEKEKFFRKMEKAGILHEEAVGKKGRIFHFILERYLELCDKVQVLISVQRELDEKKAYLLDRRQLLKNWRQTVSSLVSDLEQDETELVKLQNKLAEINKRIEALASEVKIRRKRLEEVRQTIQDSGYEAEIRKAEKEIPVLEALSGLGEWEQWELLQMLCPKT